MLLAINVGNTNIHLGLFAAEEDPPRLLKDWRIRTEPRMTADEIVLVLRGLLGAELVKVTSFAGLSTVPSLLRAMREMTSKYLPDAQVLLVEPGVKTGVPIMVDNPKEVGADRIANALAAYELYRTACLVVDFGTSTVVDAVSAKGEFLGGAIAPGIELGVNALAAGTVTLRQVELIPPRNVLGKNTIEALQSGIIYGFAGQVDGLVQRMRASISGFSNKSNVTVVAAGYLAPVVYDECATLTHHNPALTLTGLAIMLKRQRVRNL